MDPVTTIVGKIRKDVGKLVVPKTKTTVDLETPVRYKLGSTTVGKPKKTRNVYKDTSIRRGRFARLLKRCSNVFSRLVPGAETLRALEAEKEAFGAQKMSTL